MIERRVQFGEPWVTSSRYEPMVTDEEGRRFQPFTIGYSSVNGVDRVRSIRSWYNDQGSRSSVVLDIDQSGGIPRAIMHVSDGDATQWKRSTDPDSMRSEVIWSHWNLSVVDSQQLQHCTEVRSILNQWLDAYPSKSQDDTVDELLPL